MFDLLADLRSWLSENKTAQAATRRMLDPLNRIARKGDECVSSLLPIEVQAFKMFWECSRQKLKYEIQ